ncbi:hypothetical protein [Paraliomyxa miuraensis]|uniref:hypothetical protein n=1 Tax=Paraliomyxa miuraensis TaxID=376150 RepID=UPI00224D35CB|nr:hypothetical protein [Paraliomyxa miuraensis]MCX4243117.1 hypothetical protein [Paraliomyxa miuraensis]
MKPVIPTTTVLVLAASLGCASGSDRESTTAASVGDASSTATSSDQTDPTATSNIMPTTVATGAVDSGDTGGSDVDPDSTGSTTGPPPASCDDDPAACTAWILTPGSAQWVATALDAGSTLAPTGPVRAAFDVESELEGFVITDTRVHVVDLASRLWVRSDNRSDVLPELGDDEIKIAYSVPAYWGEMFGGRPGLESITFLSATTVYAYVYEIDTQSFTFDFSTTDFGAAWSAPAAPTRPAMQAAWLDVTNDEGWAQGDIMRLCGVAGAVVPHVAVLGEGDVHVSDAGYCFEFFDPVPYASFEPFGRPGAPPDDLPGAALYNETMGLWLFRGP